MVDILNVEWPGSDRDLNMSIPVMIYLEKKYGLKTRTVSIFNAYYYIVKHKPKLLFISNFVGATINSEVVKLAYLSGIKVVSLVSEGNNIHNHDLSFWGHNSDKKFYLDKMLVWSDRYFNFYKEVVSDPQYTTKVSVSGAVGFDRYKLLSFKNKECFTGEKKLGFKKVVGIGGWGFDLFFGDYYESKKEQLLKIYPENQLEMHRKDMVAVNKIYKELVKNNPDVLFILRYHPGTIDYQLNEFSGIEGPNVYKSTRRNNDKYSISDLINISDIWIGYETTTALEAWLLGKPTVLINPTTSCFIREIVSIGSPKCKTINELQQKIDEYYKTGTIASFDELSDMRKTATLETIGFDDGKNYIRAAKEVIKVLDSPERNIRVSPKIYVGAIMQITKIVLSKTLFRKRWPQLSYGRDFSKSYRDIYSEAINPEPNNYKD